MEEKKPYLTVTFIQLIYAGMFLLSKAAFNGGMNNFVFVFYRQAAATLFLLPIAIVFERKRAPPLSFKLFCKIFMLSLSGVTLSLNINCVALIYTSATLAAATTNTLPVITFFLAVLLRVETVNLRTLSGNVKLIGVTLCMVGAVTLAFYKGPHLKLLIHNGFSKPHVQEDLLLSSTNKSWIKGVFLMLTSNILWGLWLVFQGRILISYPSKLLFTTLTCLLSTLQSFVIAIAIERNLSQWKLQWDMGLLAVVYCGVVVTGVTFYLQAWCIEKKGPVFLAMSTPLSLMITVFFSAVFLGDLISLGSILGGILLIGGLYFVLWGKNKEITTEENEKDCLEEKEMA
ncbi:WAT1-related protein At5g64700-like [Telopea speciosissima]|uniref:WAT1-related protein At5g64700-like n=1 Tax=Telopea speciosissima TaxID=54955 RepID=UPI001CC74F09|nr:WAT1-related protein At5g64700-like [Telopea speciosissima]